MASKVFPNPCRIVSLDGGGIYGLYTALLLKKLCKQDKNFLTKDQVWMFAGTSSGGVNALLLAKYDNPREAVLSGELERFWEEDGVYINTNPWKQMTSMCGITSVFGTEDYLSVLEKYFGDLKLSDLKQRVLITTFNWAGSDAIPPKERHMKPKVFYNFPEEEADREEYVRDVGFSTGAPPAWRTIYRGMQDGGLYAPNPSVCAIAKAAECAHKVLETMKDEKDLPLCFHEAGLGHPPADFQHLQDDATEFAEILDDAMPNDILSNLNVLSLGCGQKKPFLPEKNADWGGLMWYTMPSNPMQNDWFPPMTSVALDGPEEIVSYQSAQLLNSKYFRLDPSVLTLPVMVALIWSVNPAMRAWVIDMIREGAKKKESRKAVTDALDWLKATSWTHP